MQPDKNKNLRHIRLERADEIDFPAEENQGWAVSYSDLLMVLLSFFVIFFSYDTDDRSRVMYDIAISIRDKIGNDSDNTNKVAGDLADQSSTLINQKESIKKVHASLLQSLKGVGFTTELVRGALIINFPGDIYPPFSYSLNENIKGYLQKILEELRPFQHQLNIIFIGHADRTAIRNRKNNIIKDNFILSSLRAAKAVEYAQELGFPREGLFAQGAADNITHSRTISVKILYQMEEIDVEPSAE